MLCQGKIGKLAEEDQPISAAHFSTRIQRTKDKRSRSRDADLNGRDGHKTGKSGVGYIRSTAQIPNRQD